MTLEIAELGIPFLVIYNQKGKQNLKNFIERIHRSLPFPHLELDVEKAQDQKEHILKKIQALSSSQKEYSTYILDTIYTEEKKELKEHMNQGKTLAEAVDFYTEQYPSKNHMYFEKKRLELVKSLFGELFYQKINSTSKKIDRFVLHSVFSLPFFFLLMYLIFWLTFTVGGFFADTLDTAFLSLQEIIKNIL